MSFQSSASPLLALVAVAAACAGNPGAVVVRDVQAIVSENGVSLNGVSLNGVSLNGVSLNGVSLNGSQLTGSDPSGTPVTGFQMAGAVFAGELSNGSTLTVRVDSVEQAANGDYRYFVSFLSDAGWSPLCGAAVSSSALSGRWRENGSYVKTTLKFTFACQGASLDKCVQLGYRPWASAPGASNLMNHHLACVRMLRADYCGDGVPRTVNGTPVNLYDNVGVQPDTEGWVFEADWGALKAKCVDEALRQAIPDPCVQALYSPTCGTGFPSSSLIRSEIQP